MTILSIQRDYGPNVSIVRIETTSSLQDILLPGWLGLKAQIDSILLVNNGPFDWNTNDVVLINIRDPIDPTISIESFFGYVFSNFLSINPIAPVYPNLQTIAAHAGGGQTDATPLNIGMNNVTIVASAGDSLILPNYVLGQTVIVINLGANAANVFPGLGDQINQLAVNSPFSIGVNTTTVFYGTQATRWFTK